MFRASQKVGHYMLVRCIGRGGFGEVWLAERQGKFATTRVAVKLPLNEQVNHAAIEQEARIWVKASGHPNVLPIIEADEYDGQIVIVSEYAPDGSLADKIKREGKLPINQAVEMTIGILNGLEFLHNRKIIHRDIKTANILLQGNNPRLADFGISRAMQNMGVSSIIGTGAYMSPESFKGIRSAQTDMWSVGVVLYVLLNGRLPFPQENDQERMYAILHENFQPPDGEIPDDLRQIIKKALAKQSENRYQNAGEMRDELKKVLAVLPPASKPISNFAPVSETEFDSDSTYYFGNASVDSTQKSAQPFSVKKEKTMRVVLPPAFNSKSSAVTTLEEPKRSKLYVVISTIVLLILVIGIGALFVNLLPRATDKSIVSGNSKTVCPKFSPDSDANVFSSKTALSKSLQPCKVDGKYGFGDPNGDLVVSAVYQDVLPFSQSSGLAGVKKDKWGFIDSSGNVKINFIYDNVKSFAEGKAMVEKDGESFSIDVNGKILNPPNYAIPDLKANVKELRLYESGRGTLPNEQRKYETIFYKSNVRYINFELNLECPPPNIRKDFKLESIWYREGKVLYNNTVDSYVESDWTGVLLTSGNGSSSYGTLETGKYRIEIKYNGKVIASKNFEIQTTLAGDWTHSNWGNITISGSGNSYTGSYSYSAGTFTLNKTAEGIYKGTWKSTSGTEWGNIREATVSADGNKITVVWNYSNPSASSQDSKTHEWTRKVN